MGILWMGNTQVILCVQWGRFGDRSDEEGKGKKLKRCSLGSPLSWVARCEGRCCQEGLHKKWEGNQRPMQENFGRERMIPQSHVLWGSVVKGGLKMPLAFTSKEVIRDPGKNNCWGEERWVEILFLWLMWIKVIIGVPLIDYELESIREKPEGNSGWKECFDFFFKKKVCRGSIVDLHSSVSFRCTSRWISFYVYLHSFLDSFPM